MAAHLRFLNPVTMSKPPGYTHVVEVTAPGRIVYIAGQLGTDVGGKVVGQAGDFQAQAVQVFENLKAALAEVGATFSDVVKINNYFTDLKQHLPIYREVRGRYFTGPNPPASTTIEISALAREGALLETEAVAILPSAGKAPAAKAATRSKLQSKPRAKKPPLRAATKKPIKAAAKKQRNRK